MRGFFRLGLARVVVASEFLAVDLGDGRPLVFANSHNPHQSDGNLVDNPNSSPL